MHFRLGGINGADAIWRENTHSRRLNGRASFVYRTKTFSFLHVSFISRTYLGWIVMINNYVRRTNPIILARLTSMDYELLLKHLSLIHI